MPSALAIAPAGIPSSPACTSRRNRARRCSCASAARAATAAVESAELGDPELAAASCRPVLSEKELTARDHRWKAIREAVEDEPAIYTSAGRAAHLRRLVDEGYNRNSLRNWFQMHWRGGKTPTSGSGVELPPTEPQPAAQSSGGEVNLHAALKMMGYAPDVAEMLIAEAQKKVSSDDPTLLLIAVTQVARGYDAEATTKPPRRNKAVNEPAVAEATDPFDLRAAGGASSDPDEVHEAMVRAGTAGGIGVEG